jgi:response regulator RpfG family c-di-GMP phosphodiesterase
MSSLPLELDDTEAVADVYDALTHDRPYRRAFAPSEALALVHELSSSQFEPRVVDAFVGLVQPPHLVGPRALMRLAAAS